MTVGDGPTRGHVPPEVAPGEGAVTEDRVTAVVLTHLRPRLAGDVTRSLSSDEGLADDRIVVVVNGPGGLDDAELEERVRMVRLPRNTGPAGGFRAGLETAFADPTTQWAYLCEDDVGLFDLPSPRLSELVGRLRARAGHDAPVGAVVAYGRNFVGRGAHTVNVVPPDGRGDGFTPVDVACWGATLVSRAVVDAGILPDPTWFFGLEDFDFFCRVREAGFAVLVDDRSARALAAQQTSIGRDQAIRSHRPNDADEAWRAYYHARNSIALIRRHGRPSWFGWEAGYALRHLQVARSSAERKAIVHGLWDGILGRSGENARYGRQVGEFGDPDGAGVSPTR
jgi:rhamnopyranosyl-N-acetylglucosaminyl-diphospho-decaprenol beta-1,3/1,4-galactofuranosyltransferase